MHGALVHVDLKRYSRLYTLYYFRPCRSVTCGLQSPLYGLLFTPLPALSASMDSHFRLCSYSSLPFGFTMLSK